MVGLAVFPNPRDPSCPIVAAHGWRPTTDCPSCGAAGEESCITRRGKPAPRHSRRWTEEDVATWYRMMAREGRAVAPPVAARVVKAVGGGPRHKTAWAGIRRQQQGG